MRIRAILALLLCVSLLAGCIPKTGTETVPSGSGIVTTGPTETSAAPTATSAAATEPTETTQATEPVEVWVPPMGYETNEQGIPILGVMPVTDGDNGFTAYDSGRWFLSVHNGKLEWFPGKMETISFDILGQTHTIIFSWCSNAGEIGICDIERWERGIIRDPAVIWAVPGSNRYAVISRKDLGYELPPLLLDLQTMELTDPFANAAEFDYAQVSDYGFSPDGKSALLHLPDSGPEGYWFLDTASGKITTVEEWTGIPGANHAEFVSSELLAVNVIEKTFFQEWTADGLVYDLTDGSVRTIYEDVPFGWLHDVGGMDTFGQLHAYKNKSKLHVVDCVTGTDSAVEMESWAQLIHSCGIDKLEVRDPWGICYLVEADGTITPLYEITYTS